MACDERWQGQIEEWWWRVRIADGRVVTDMRKDHTDDWKIVTHQGVGSTGREKALEQALLASRPPRAARGRRKEQDDG